MTTTTTTTPAPAPRPYRVTWWYQGRKSSTTLGTEEAARTFAASLHIRRVIVRPV